MCRQQAMVRSTPQSNPRVLLTLSSFHCCDDKGEKAPLPPSKTSACLTVAFIVLFLFAFEQSIRVFITTYFSDYHPVLELERHRHILARHCAVDGFSCAYVAFIGYRNRHELKHLMTFERDDKFHERMHGYNPAGHQVLLYFFAYQVKNMHDTIVWEDGLLFICHHILSGATAWLGMYPGVGTVYSIFFMGISEISTCVLCLLANFDPVFGIIGLEDAFPGTRVVTGIIFIVSFIICRIMLWPLFAYHFLHDTQKALKATKTEGQTVNPLWKFSLQLIASCLVGLSLLQLLWLGEIVGIAQEEISKLF